MKNIVVFALMACFLSSTVHAEACLALPDKHSFGITYQTVHRRGEKVATETWRYWKQGNKVAYQYPQRGISEVWYLYTNGQFGFERWFASQKRIISYEPGDLKSLGRHLRWRQVSQLVNEQDEKLLKRDGNTTFRCLAATRYKGKRKNGDNIEVIRLRDNNQVAQIKATSGVAAIQTILINFEQSEHADRFFAVSDHFPATDFSDIGDNEADPFLRQLITLGFVEHRKQEGAVHYPGH